MNNHDFHTPQIKNDDRMVFEAGQPVYANKNVKLTFKTVDALQKEIQLEPQHGKKMHLIIVSDDLSFFEHIHPEYRNGKFEANYSFPFGGKFLLFTEFRPIGKPHRTEMTALRVEGPARPAQVYNSVKTISDVSGYKVALIAEEKIYVGDEISIPVSITHNKLSLNAEDLDDYLEAKVHAIMINTQNKIFSHLHASTSHDNILLHAWFKKPGFYRSWIQFSVNGRLITSDFVLKVEEKDQAALK